MWATANTRAAIFDAFRRREVYATTGPRMVVRMFAGWDFSDRDFAGNWVDAGYRRGVPMGGVLPARTGDGAPTFLISALRDPMGANLDRVQVVKGWVDANGNAQERVFDVVWSDPATRRIANGRLTPVGNTVNLSTASYANSICANEYPSRNDNRTSGQRTCSSEYHACSATGSCNSNDSCNDHTSRQYNTVNKTDFT